MVRARRVSAKRFANSAARRARRPGIRRRAYVTNAASSFLDTRISDGRRPPARMSPRVQVINPTASITCNTCRVRRSDRPDASAT